MAPGTAGSSLRATYAAGELLGWIDVNSVEQEDVFRWIDENVPMENAAELARAWAAVLTEAEALMRGDETAYDALDDAGYTMEQPYRSTGRVKWAAWKLLSLFTQILDRTERAEYRYEAPGAVSYTHLPEQAVAGGGQLDLALFRLAAAHVLLTAQGQQPLRRIVFVDHARSHLPDIQVLLAHAQQDVYKRQPLLLVFPAQTLRWFAPEGDEGTVGHVS